MSSPSYTLQWKYNLVLNLSMHGGKINISSGRLECLAYAQHDEYRQGHLNKVQS